MEEGLFLFRKIGAILRAVWGRADVDDTGVFAAGVLVADGMADVCVPEHCVAGHDLWDGDQAGDEIGMPLRADAERTAGGRAAQISLVHILLKSAKEHVGDALRDGNEAESAVFRPLACERRPALIGAEHAAHRGRRNLLSVQPVRGVERVIASPVTGEDVLVHLLIAGVDPALDGACIHVRGKPKRLVPGLTAAHTVGVGALPVGIEDAFVFPQAIEKGTRLGEPRVLPRHDLRLGPVNVEDLGLAGFERGEVSVEAALLAFELFVMVGLEILADLRKPVAREIGGEHSAKHRAAGLADRLTVCLGDCVVPYVAVVEFGHHRVPSGDLIADDVDGSGDVVLYTCVGASQGLATRRELALERDDLVTYVEICTPSRCPSAGGHGYPSSEATPRRHDSAPASGNSQL